MSDTKRELTTITPYLLSVLHRSVARSMWVEGADYSTLDAANLEIGKAFGYYPAGKSYLFRKYVFGMPEFKRYYCVHENYFKRRAVCTTHVQSVTKSANQRLA